MTQRTPLFKRATTAALVTLTLVACGGGDDDATPTSAADTGAPAPDSTVPGSTPGSVPAGDAIAVPASVDPWKRTAAEFRGDVGQQYEFPCPAGGDVLGAPIWGTEIYTDDSAVCIAAVHVGLVNPEDGGTARIVIEEGQTEYASGTAFGVSSARYSAWAGSFSFPDAPVGTGTFEVSLDSWEYTVYSLGLEEGDTVSVACAPDGPLGAVWGSGPYTGDSSVCSAALHAGVFPHADGGAVTIVVGGQVESYDGSTANGVTTSDYGAYGPSFEIVAIER